jgi:hypothetical protein
VKARQTMGEAVAELSEAWQALVFELRAAFGLLKPVPRPAPRFSAVPCAVCPDHPVVLDAQDPTRELPVWSLRDGEADAKAADVVDALNADADAELGPGLYWEPRTA